MYKQYIESVKSQQNATYDIDREPFDVKIIDAMNELRSIKEPMELDFEDHDGDDAYFGDQEIAVVGVDGDVAGLGEDAGIGAGLDLPVRVVGGEHQRRNGRGAEAKDRQRDHQLVHRRDSVV